MALGNGHKPGRFMTPAHTRRMFIRKNPSEPGCAVTTLYGIMFVGAVPSAFNAVYGPMTALAQSLYPKNVVLQ